jgi:murein DD-endopeptidase MepM/ murein hydrolase activator NlpD
MTNSRRFVTIMVHRDGALESRSLRLPIWVFRLMLGGALGMVALLLLATAFYAPLIRAAAAVPFLRREISRLEADNAKIREVVMALDSAERQYGQLRSMMGADLVRDPLSFSSTLPLSPAVQARPADAHLTLESGASTPRHWPLDEAGYITRGQIGTGTVDEAHPGLDIAVPPGTVVRVAGGGTVIQAGPDAEYGIYILVQHPDGYQSLYGHLSRILVNVGQEVGAGEVIGLSGNTGRSSAPHLHFEIRQEGKVVDPLTLVQEGT